MDYEIEECFGMCQIWSTEWVDIATWQISHKFYGAVLVNFVSIDDEVNQVYLFMNRDEILNMWIAGMRLSRQPIPPVEYTIHRQESGNYRAIELVASCGSAVTCIYLNYTAGVSPHPIGKCSVLRTSLGVVINNGIRLFTPFSGTKEIDGMIYAIGPNIIAAIPVSVLRNVLKSFVNISESLLTTILNVAVPDSRIELDELRPIM